MRKLVVAIIFILLSLSCNMAQIAQVNTPQAKTGPTVMLTLGASAECSEAVRAYAYKIQPYLREYLDALGSTSNKARSTLTDSIQRIQKARGDILQLQPPSCAKEPFENIVSGMDDMSTAFTTFMANSSGVDADVINHLNAGLVSLQMGMMRLDALRVGKPTPTLEEVIAKVTPYPTLRPD